jgi:probable Rubsico expression protein CbbX
MGWWSRKTAFIVAALLGTAVALALAWSYLTHPVFGIAVGIVVMAVILVAFSRDAWRQTHNVDAPLASPIHWAETDPGLRREWAGYTLRTPGALTVRPAPSAPKSKAASSGPSRQASRVTPRRRKGAAVLPPEMTVTLAEERRVAGIDDLFSALDDELVGLVPVKKKVAEIGSLLLVDRARQRFGLSAARPNLHMCFTGAPGTGKTTVALKLADLLYRLGYLERGHLVHAMRDDLVGEYIGHTAPKTKQVLDRAMGGVLFIDEAYSLFRGSDSKDYGQECIDILLQVMENDRDKLVVILAGYKDRMDDFFESNPGMSSRIAHHLDFADYDLEELLAIGQTMVAQSSYYLSDEAKAAFRDYLGQRMQQPRFANARSVRNELERARLRHAYRLAADPEESRNRDDLMRLEAADILLSPVSTEAGTG